LSRTGWDHHTSCCIAASANGRQCAISITALN
jgi:hypothetical protein